MNNILDEIARYTVERVESAKSRHSLEEVKKEAYRVYEEQQKEGKENFLFEKKLREPEITFICECKKASPSKGIIAEDFKPLEIAAEYESAGAGAISVLTEPKWFMGKDSYLSEISHRVSIPCLRKDFVVDEYMIYEAKLLGASAILLICSITKEDKLKEYIKICDSLGLSALVEAHDEEEIEKAIAAGARIIGVNNRNLKNFTVDINNSRRLRALVPKEILFVAESGIKTKTDIDILKDAKVDAVLIGETFMRAKNKKAMIDELLGRTVIPEVKICGIKRDADVEIINELLPEYAGFVFYGKSRRNVSYSEAERLRKKMDKRIKAVGVFVDTDIETITGLFKKRIIDIAQLHGQEDDEYINKLRMLNPDMKIIKAYIVHAEEDLKKAGESIADYVLLDAGLGDGKCFDWSLLTNMNRQFFLAGGLNVTNVKEAVKRFHPFAVDISSAVETEGVKDYTKIKQFIENVRRA